MGAVKQRAALIFLCFLAGCGDSGGEAPEQAQRISLEDARQTAPEPAVSPETERGRWNVTADGQAIDFGLAEGQPLLTLACDLDARPVALSIVRHVEARPGQKALFPVIGNGTVSRFKVDATLHDGEWRWEGQLPASDSQLDVFTGPRELEATLPGGGSVLIGGSRIPGEFINWCRSGGEVPPVETPPPAGATPGSPAR